MANTKNAKVTKVENKEENKELEKEVVVNPSESEEIIALKKQLEEMYAEAKKDWQTIKSKFRRNKNNDN